MISVDTNVLIRVLVDDPTNTAQVEHARRAVSQYQTLYISQIVQVETVWVLKGPMVLLNRIFCKYLSTGRPIKRFNWKMLNCSNRR